MANKTTRDERIQKEREKQFVKASKKLIWVPVAGLLAFVAVMLLFLVNWGEVYNSGFGVEVKISGYNTLSNAIYGTVPLYCFL